MRVAGASARAGDGLGEPGGDTATLQAVSTGDPAQAPYGAPDAPREEIEVGPGMPQGPAPRSRKPARARRASKAPKAAKAPGEPGRPGGGRTGLKVAAVAAGALVLVGGGAVAAFAFTGGEGDKTVVQPSPLADAPKQPPVDLEALAAARHKQAVERASRNARKETVKRPALLPKGTPIPTKKPEDKDEGGSGGAPTAGNPMPAGEAQAYAKAIMDNYGFNPSTQFGCLVNLWNKESHWNYRASNPTSGAYGIPQALPGSKMASEGADWRTNAKTQIRWGLGYIKGRYGSPCAAWQHSQSTGWY
ncbi:lytic transglycosylase domain-containing protein [Actinomadura sp. NPDC047616]|uniref:aggregation-promoting factor C-terminal-like domain-containing protein n=1 Tax=Actinomadura sp. NPDC047616 TaxID=3155914 RepID=UPI0033C4E0BD